MPKLWSSRCCLIQKVTRLLNNLISSLWPLFIVLFVSPPLIFNTAVIWPDQKKANLLDATNSTLEVEPMFVGCCMMLCLACTKVFSLLPFATVHLWNKNIPNLLVSPWDCRAVFDEWPTYCQKFQDNGGAIWFVYSFLKIRNQGNILGHIVVSFNKYKAFIYWLFVSIIIRDSFPGLFININQLKTKQSTNELKLVLEDLSHR